MTVIENLLQKCRDMNKREIIVALINSLMINKIGAVSFRYIDILDLIENSYLVISFSRLLILQFSL